MIGDLSFDTIEDRVCYLNHAKEAILSPAVRLAGYHALRRPAWYHEEVDIKSEIRTMFASLLGASPNHIAITASTAFSLTLAAFNIGRLHSSSGSGGKIIMLQDEMCSQVYPWQKVVEDNPSSSFQLDVIPPCDDYTTAVLEHLDESVAVVAIPPLHWSHGSLLDLEAISTRCHDLGAYLIIDATQAIGMIPLDVMKMKPTMVACSIQKWLRAPPGLSLTYIHPDVYDKWQPLDQHGRSRNFGKPDWNAFPGEMDPHKGYPETFCEGAKKFDSGGTINPILLTMLHASLQEVVTLNIADEQLKLKTILQPLMDWALAKGWWIPPQHYYHLVGLRPSNYPVPDMLKVCERLEEEKIFISVRNGVFRISPYVTNTAEDIQRLIHGFETYM